MNCRPRADRWGLWLIVWWAPWVRLQGNGRRRRGHWVFWAGRSCRLPVRTAFSVFSVALLSWCWWWSFNWEGWGWFCSPPTHGSTDCYQQLGAGFRELLASHQARASRKEKWMRWGLLHFWGVSPVDNADLMSKVKMICLEIQMPCAEWV